MPGHSDSRSAVKPWSAWELGPQGEDGDPVLTLTQSPVEKPTYLTRSAAGWHALLDTLAAQPCLAGDEAPDFSAPSTASIRTTKNGTAAAPRAGSWPDWTEQELSIAPEGASDRRRHRP